MSLKGLIGRTGGKSRLKKKIRGMIPPHTTYIEPFVGGGSVFFSAPADPNRKEVINDKDKEVAQIYMDVKNVGDKIQNITPPDKEGFNRLKGQTKFSSPVERLRRNLILSLYSFRSDRRNFAFSKARMPELQARQSQGSSQKKYEKYKERLKNTRILNQDYKTVIKKYDNPDAFIYLDPPYSTASDNNDYKDNDIKIEDIINLLKTVKGKFILSYDNNATARRLAKSAGFKVLTVSTKYTDGRAGGGGHTINKKELLIRNY
tara:strand:+ start:9745 stop:10527 length:783 start_codon:yes stop_codon:yes gene_type:complete